MFEIPLSTQLYILPAGASFEQEEAFAAAPVIEYIGTDEVYVRGLRFSDTHGTFNREIFKRIERWLRGKGIKRIRYRHKGREVER